MNFSKLVLLRHGESQWNLENRFTGWTNIDLTVNGKNEAKNAGVLLSENNIEFDFIYSFDLQCFSYQHFIHYFTVIFGSILERIHQNIFE